jgi:translation initiation factor 3 subunit A
MKLYMKICVDQRKNFHAKEGFYQYKNIAGPTAIQSFDAIINYYLELSEAKAAEAAEATRGKEGGDTTEVEDLEESATPESVMLASVSTENAQARLERVELIPWIKFLWEAYRSVLDIIRNYSKMESTYHATARRAMQFCLQYERKREFHRLCEQMADHLQHIREPYRPPQFPVDISNPETLSLQLETRFELVNCAGKIGLWQEAFRAMEAIADLVKSSGREPSAFIKQTYFHKLAQIFWRSNDFVLHAAAWHKFYYLVVLQHRVSKTQAPENIAFAANSVLLSTLCVPIANQDTLVKPVNSLAPEFVPARETRLCGLLEIPGTPTRKQLVTDMINTMSVLQFAAPELRTLYNVLEEDFQPLQLWAKVEPVLKYLGEQAQFKQYVEPLKYVLAMRILKQVGLLCTRGKAKGALLSRL